MVAEEIYDEVSLKDLPKFAALNQQVQEIIRRSGCWERYGVDLSWSILAVIGALLSYPMIGSDLLSVCISGVILLGLCHASLAMKASHLATHGGLSPSKSKLVTKIIATFYVELCGSFSEVLGDEFHIKEHHPHTNIIGIGDSSTWKYPSVPKYVYMFITPLMVPLVTALVSVKALIGRPMSLLKYLVVAGSGLTINLYLMMYISGLTIGKALLCTWIVRAMFAIPYIHVNIFQHIGLPMYSQENRPKKIYQMSTGCLNLSRNIILDYIFGHSIISCHVEHHLFPYLSDHMCLKIKPVVSKFLKEHGLPYKESPYMGRLELFLRKYNELMVNAPPITHFVGIQ